MKRLIKRDEILWNNNPIARILIYLPAKIISSILAFPLIILSLPAALLGKQSEIRWVRILLEIQHTVSLSFWYFIGDAILPSVLNIPGHIKALFILVVTYFNFKHTIKTLTNETLSKTYSNTF